MVKKKKWKMIVQGVIYLAVFALFAGLLSFLTKSSQEAEEKEMAWMPDTKAEPEKGFVAVAENDALKLYFDPDTVQLIVEDKASGQSWRSNPENAESDSIAFGQNKMLVRSLMDISYADGQSSYFTVNSFAGSVQDRTYSYEYRDNGVYINFQFAKQGFEIPCFFGIQDDRFVARVLSDQIKQHGSLQVAAISLLPYFGSGSMEEEGYLFVPDGSGALIYFNNQKQTYQAYSQKVYGRNLALNLQTSQTVTEDATMPVFGIRKENASLLAVITKGEYQAEIRAEVARKTTSNNIVYSNILYIQNENNTLLAGSDKEETTIMLSPQHNNFPFYEVSYFFLGKDAGYTEMASRYRRYLIEEKGMQETAAARQKKMNLSFLGGIKVRETFLGVPYHTVKALTSFGDLQNRASSLIQSTGNGFLVSMSYLDKGGSESKIATKVSYESALGGKKGYQKLAKSLEEAGVPFYPIFDPLSIRKSGNGYRSYHGIRNVSRSAALQYEYLLTSGSRDSGKQPYYLVSPRYVAKIVESLTKSAAQNNILRLGLSSLGDKTYADYRTDSISGNESGEYWEQALATAADAQELLLKGAFAYAFPYADVIIDVPVNSSQYDMEDESVPFYEMVVGGSAALYGEPVNLSGNVREMFLKSVEYGVSPSFLLMAADRDAMQDTDYQKYYSLSYGDWEEKIKEMLNELSALDGVLGQGIAGHKKCSDTVYATTYQNGAVVYVNYGKEAVTLDGVSIPPMGFVRKGEK